MRPSADGRATEIDDLIRDAFAEELPADVEGRLEATLAAFLAERRSEAAARPWWLAALGRPVLAFASGMMVIAGVALSTVEARTASVDPLDRLRAVLASSIAVSRASAMDCSVSVSDIDGRRTGVIQWDHSTGTRRRDALPPAIEQWLTPPALARAMYHEWILLRAEDGHGEVALFFRSADGFAYEIRTDRASRPRLVHRTPLSLPPPDDDAGELIARCTWDGERN